MIQRDYTRGNVPILLLFLVVLLAVGGGALWLAHYRDSRLTQTPTSTGTTEESSYTNASEDLIVIDTPMPGASITSPLRVSGEARGTWYFEATFPVILVDWDGRIIAEGYAEAQPDPATGEVNWMTEEFVPFVATITFTKPPYGERGTLILRKDNPSGLPEHDAALEIPIRFE